MLCLVPFPLFQVYLTSCVSCIRLPMLNLYNHSHSFMPSLVLVHIMARRQFHDDVIKWKHFPRYWPFVRGIHRSPANSPHKGQSRGAVMFSLICVWINVWVNNRKAGDLRHYRAHYDVSEMSTPSYHSCAIDKLLLTGPLGTGFGEISIKLKTFQTRKLLWKHRLPNGNHFVSTLMS